MEKVKKNKRTTEIYGRLEYLGKMARGGPVVDTTRAAVTYFQPAVKYSRIKRRPRERMADEWRRRTPLEMGGTL